MKKIPYKIGDLVILTNLSSAFKGYCGKVGVIKGYDNSGLIPYKVYFPDGEYFWFRANQVIRLEGKLAEVLYT